jgi:predicted nuclease of predicted toxin-antitoxin system
MRFVADECTGPTVARWLRQLQHDVLSVYEEARGLDDDEILQKAVADNRILITNDKDFGEMIFREGKTHRGVILLRLEDERVANKIGVLERLLEQYADQLAGNFVVATESTVRIVHLRGD